MQMLHCEGGGSVTLMPVEDGIDAACALNGQFLDKQLRFPSCPFDLANILNVHSKVSGTSQAFPLLSARQACPRPQTKLKNAPQYASKLSLNHNNSIPVRFPQTYTTNSKSKSHLIFGVDVHTEKSSICNGSKTITPARLPASALTVELIDLCASIAGVHSREECRDICVPCSTFENLLTGSCALRNIVIAGGQYLPAASLEQCLPTGFGKQGRCMRGIIMPEEMEC